MAPHLISLPVLDVINRNLTGSQTCVVGSHRIVTLTHLSQVPILQWYDIFMTGETPNKFKTNKINNRGTSYLLMSGSIEFITNLRL